uniref:Uncharacterized protein n=1 Tax=Solanum lycopersicum TaxID=4081 RepID=A0A3Q7EXF1_SOLLC
MLTLNRVARKGYRCKTREASLIQGVSITNSFQRFQVKSNIVEFNYVMITDLL